MKWKGLFAVLLGLLMIGVTAGSANAQVFQDSQYTKNRNTWNLGLPTKVTFFTRSLQPGDVVAQKATPIAPKPQVFLDEDQVRIYFSDWDSYTYKGTIYLAFQW